MKRWRSFSTLVFLNAAMAFQGQTAVAVQGSTAGLEGLTLEQAVARALESNPMIRATSAAERAAEAQLAEAKSGRLPGLQFKQTYTNSNNPVYVFGSLLEQGKFSEQNFDPAFLNNPDSLSNFRSSLNLQIPIFNRFQISSGIEQARLRRSQADLEAEWVRQQIRLQVIEAYFGLVVAGMRKQVAAEAVLTAEAEVDSIRAKVEQGLAVTSDLLAMQVQLADFRQQQVQAGGAERTALAALNTVLAQPIEAEFNLAGTLEDKDFSVPGQSELLSAALRNRPDYLNAARQIEIAEQQLKVAKGQVWPDLNLFAQYGLSSRDLASGSSDFAVGASLNFNILDFGRSARVEQAIASSEGMRAESESLASGIRFEVVQAHQKFQVSRERLLLTAAAVDQAAEALRIVEDRHEVGLTTVTEVLRAQTALLAARLNQLGARYDYYLSYAGILRSSGSLTDVAPFTN